MIEESMMTKEDNEEYENSTKCRVCNNDYVDDDVKVKDHCHNTGKDRSSAHRDRNINLNLIHKIPVVFNDLKHYDSYIIMQEVGKLNFKCLTR